MTTTSNESLSKSLLDLFISNRPVFITTTSGAESGQVISAEGISAVAMGTILPGQTVFVRDSASGVWYAYGAQNADRQKDRKLRKKNKRDKPEEVEFVGCVLYSKIEDKKTDIKPNHSSLPFKYLSQNIQYNSDFWNNLSSTNLNNLSYSTTLPTSLPNVTRGNAESNHINSFLNTQNTQLNSDLLDFKTLLNDENDPWIADGEGFVPTYSISDLTLTTTETVVIKEPVVDSEGNIVETGKTATITCNYTYKQIIYNICVGSLVNIADPSITRTYTTQGIGLFLTKSKCTEVDDETGEERDADDPKLWRILGNIERRNLPITGGNEIVEYCNVRSYSAPAIYSYGRFKFVADKANYRRLNIVSPNPETPGGITVDYKAGKSTWRYSEDQFSTVIGKGIFIYNDPPPPHLEDPRIRFGLYNKAETEEWNAYRTFPYNTVSNTFVGNFHDYYSLSAAQSFTDISTYNNYYWDIPRHLWINFPPGANVIRFDSWKIYLFENVEVTEVDPNDIDTFCPNPDTLNKPPEEGGDPDFPPGTRLYGVKKVYLAGIPEAPTIVFPDLFLQDTDAGAGEVDSILPVVSFTSDEIYVSLFINLFNDQYASTVYAYVIDRNTYAITSRRVLRRDNITFKLNPGQPDNDIAEYCTYLSMDARNTKPLEYFQFANQAVNRDLQNILAGLPYKAFKQANQGGKFQETDNIIYDINTYDSQSGFLENQIDEITITALNIPRQGIEASKYSILSYHLGVYTR